MKLQVFRGSISSIPYFQTPQVFLCSLTTLVTRASRNDMVMRRPSQKLWVPEAHFLLKLVGKLCQPTAWNPETRQLESKLTLTILRTLDDVFFLKGDSLIITKRSESISTFRDEARCLANSVAACLKPPEAWTGAPVRMPRCWKWWIEPYWTPLSWSFF